jgi:hypothetical protein
VSAAFLFLAGMGFGVLLALVVNWAANELDRVLS